MPDTGFANAACQLIAGQRVRMDDDTRLQTVVVLPAGSGRYPVLLLRTPYSTGSHLAEAFGWARRGIAAVIQDVRGRYESEGRWLPYQSERTDGLATVRWLRAQLWCDGRIIAYGSSYSAHCALEVAADPTSGLVGVVTAVPALSLAHTITEPGGVPRLLAHASWWPTHGEQRTSRGPVLDTVLAADPTVLQHLPVGNLPDRLGVPLAGWSAAWAERRPDPPTGTTASPPLLSVGGLYDVYCDAAVEIWQRWRGPSADLVLGAWQHDLGLVHRHTNGDRPRQAGHRIGVSRFVAGWIEQLLSGRRRFGRRLLSAVESTPGWLTGDTWHTGGRRVPLHPRGPADHTFLADPGDPHPATLGPAEVTTQLARPDVSVWTSDPLDHDVTVLGTPVVTLARIGSSDVPRGTALDWVVRLAEIDTTGRTTQLSHTAIRTAAATSCVRLPPLSHRFDAGHRLTVGVSGHLFPVYPRDPQDGTDPLTATRLSTIRRTVTDVTLNMPSLDEPHTALVAADAAIGALLT